MEVQVGAVSNRSCNDCHTTSTPLWRAGPDGPRSLCNACGLRYRKRRKALDKGGAKKSRKRSNGATSGHGHSHDHDDEVIFGCNLEPYTLHGRRQFKLKEEEEAAILLMALSCAY
ncbi:hypothetical protein PIB30_022009 [Stylosanthes scabra]|uniref:GATA-type domain-containing protein n=1 Tax=Stylosanthes scabra TaxID=79078 RepID=A0ABU6XAM9_9FABA|nr:hypothetical protein [Stylosanthes scabra]